VILAEFIEEPNIEKLAGELRHIFEKVQWGIQGDAWIWVTGGEQKVAIDNFTSLAFQVKCAVPESDIADRVLAFLSRDYQVDVYENPVLENHE
jgi:hypothetical protein